MEKRQFTYRVNDYLLRRIKVKAVDFGLSISDCITYYVIYGMSLHRILKLHQQGKIPGSIQLDSLSGIIRDSILGDCRDFGFVLEKVLNDD